MPATHRVDPAAFDGIETLVAGIPCLAVIDHAEDHGRDGWEVAWSIHDRRGYPAPWLARKLTPRAEQAIESALVDHLADAARGRADWDRAVRAGRMDEL